MLFRSPITAVQTEYSLWTRNPEIAVLQACDELGVTFVAFSPVARGFLCGQPIDLAGLDAKDIRRSMPRFTPENYAANERLLPAYHEIAKSVGCTPAQLALAWLLHKHPGVIPIPGTANIAHLEENMGAVNVALSGEHMAALEALIHPGSVLGARYNSQNSLEVDTETW